jgi:UDP-2-acetamido-3-amino-2,3-dideoxy-glucuronate N-acetyltransferase
LDRVARRVRSRRSVPLYAPVDGRSAPRFVPQPGISAESPVTSSMLLRAVFEDAPTSAVEAGAFIHPAAEVAMDATLGPGCKVWRQAHIREGASIGAGSIVGAGVYIGAGVRVGANCKIQNQALLYEGVELERGVFVGPQVCFTNDHLPRAVNSDLSLKTAADWHLGRTRVREGASVGAQSVVVTGVTIGRWALIGAGTVVTRDVPDHALVYGNPARVRGWVCRCARRLRVGQASEHAMEGWCEECQAAVSLPPEASGLAKA